MINLKFRKELEQKENETKKQYNKRFRNENPYDKNMKINCENRRLSFYNKTDLLKAIEIAKQCDFKFPKTIIFDIDDPIPFNDTNSLYFNTYGEKFIAFIDYLVSIGLKFKIHGEWGEIVKEIK